MWWNNHHNCRTMKMKWMINNENEYCGKIRVKKSISIKNIAHRHHRQYHIVLNLFCFPENSYEISLLFTCCCHVSLSLDEFFRRRRIRLQSPDWIHKDLLCLCECLNNPSALSYISQRFFWRFILLSRDVFFVTVTLCRSNKLKFFTLGKFWWKWQPF